MFTPSPHQDSIKPAKPAKQTSLSGTDLVGNVAALVRNRDRVSQSLLKAGIMPSGKWLAEVPKVNLSFGRLTYT
jgi:hypothetical protein